MRISDWSSDVCSSDLALKPAAPIHPVTQGEIEPALLFNAGLYDPTTKTVDVQACLKAEAYAAAHPPDHDHHHRHDVNRHDESTRAFCLTYDKPLAWDRFNAWIEMLISPYGGNILRIKCMLTVAGSQEPIVIHGVPPVFPTQVRLDAWPNDARSSKMHFILA